jgi:hypothetical protein
MPKTATVPESNAELPGRDVIKQLGRIEVEQLDGNRIPLADLWKDGPVALVFLRHYG